MDCSVRLQSSPVVVSDTGPELHHMAIVSDFRQSYLRERLDRFCQHRLLPQTLPLAVLIAFNFRQGSGGPTLPESCFRNDFPEGAKSPHLLTRNRRLPNGFLS